jgi:hypothetical protein
MTPPCGKRPRAALRAPPGPATPHPARESEREDIRYLEHNAQGERPESTWKQASAARDRNLAIHSRYTRAGRPRSFKLGVLARGHAVQRTWTAAAVRGGSVPTPKLAGEAGRTRSCGA